MQEGTDKEGKQLKSYKYSSRSEMWIVAIIAAAHVGKSAVDVDGVAVRVVLHRDVMSATAAAAAAAVS